MADESSNALPAGTRLGEFELRSVLGVGGFGIVYLAWDHDLEREVAVKEYMPAMLAGRTVTQKVSLASLADRETFELGLRSFVGEARMLARFDHPALVKVYRYWEANGTAYMAMPFYRGRSLHALRNALPKAPDEAFVRALLAPLLGALERLHAQDIFHRDIAPDNVIVQDDGMPVLLDFGAARRVLSDRSQTLTAILKPSYAPIEQYGEAGPVRQGPWTDLYALGATLHFLLRGRPPPPATGRMLHDELLPMLGHAPPGYSETLLSTIDWMLRPRPAERPQSVAQVRDALEGRTAVPAAAAVPVAPIAPTVLDLGHVDAPASDHADPSALAPTQRAVPMNVQTPTQRAMPVDVPVPTLRVAPPASDPRPRTDPATAPDATLAADASARAHHPPAVGRRNPWLIPGVAALAIAGAAAAWLGTRGGGGSAPAPSPAASAAAAAPAGPASAPAAASPTPDVAASAAAPPTASPAVTAPPAAQAPAQAPAPARTVAAERKPPNKVDGRPDAKADPKAAARGAAKEEPPIDTGPRPAPTLPPPLNEPRSGPTLPAATRPAEADRPAAAPAASSPARPVAAPASAPGAGPGAMAAGATQPSRQTAPGPSATPAAGTAPAGGTAVVPSGERPAGGFALPAGVKSPAERCEGRGADVSACIAQVCRTVASLRQHPDCAGR